MPHAHRLINNKAEKPWQMQKDEQKRLNVLYPVKVIFKIGNEKRGKIKDLCDGPTDGPKK